MNPKFNPLASWGAALRHRLGYGRKPRLLTALCERSALRLMRRAAAAAPTYPPPLRGIDPARSLFVAPHMDDEAIGAGGAAELLRRAGAATSLVFTADCAGTLPDAARNAAIAAERGAEAERAAAHMDMEYHGHLGFPTGSLSRHERALGDALAGLIAGWRPARIFAPYPTDGHRDHQATAAALALALERGGWRGEVWCYEVWSPCFPNALLDITGAADAKRDFIGCYPSQLEDLDYVEGALGLNRLRGEAAGVEYAEAYFATDAPGFIALARGLIG